MKFRFMIGLLLFYVLCINVDAFSAIVQSDSIDQIWYNDTTISVETSCLCQAESLSKYDCWHQESYTNQNNNLTVYSIIVAVLGILIGVITNMAITMYNTRKDGINELKKNTEKTKDVIEEKIILMDKIQRGQDYQNRYMQRINQYLFKITYSIVENNNSEVSAFGSNIREDLYHHYYIINLFLPLSESSNTAFDYFKVKGTIDDIDDLSFLADNDPDERKRKMAIETIGFIKARLMKGQAS